jgi:catechol 2,3-dioxygenase-like lactoylglutathione lyase family enzyme
MTIEINGMAHVILTVSRFEIAREFYRKLLPEFGMKAVHDGDKLFYCVGARTAIGIEPCAPALAGERFVQQRVGLHHLCLRARSREDVDRCAALLKEMNATIVRGPMEGTWAPGYYYVLFEEEARLRGRSPVASVGFRKSGEPDAHGFWVIAITGSFGEDAHHDQTGPEGFKSVSSCLSITSAAWGF